MADIKSTDNVTLYTDLSLKSCHSESVPASLTATDGQINTIAANYAYNGSIWKPIRLTSVYDAVIVSDIGDSATEDGRHYRAENYQASVNIATALSYLIKIPTGELPATFFSFTSSKGLLATVYENPTVTANGTGLTVFNNNRNSVLTSTITAFLNPTISANGTQLEQFLVPGANQGGSVSSSELRIILKENEDYLITISSLDNVNSILTKVIWFE